MRPLRVFAKNYCSWPEIDWDVPTGVTAIHGSNDGGEGISSNGAGKTRLLEILPIALWGPSLPWSEYVPSGSEGLTTEIGCEFEHAGKTYIVRRRYNPKGRGTSETHFGRLGDSDGQDWYSGTLTRSSQAETQAEIARVLGLTEETFAHSVFSKQGARHFADPTLTPRERKEILAEALGLGVYDTLLQLVKADSKALESEIAANEAQAQMLQDELATDAYPLDFAHYEQDVFTATADFAATSLSVQEFKDAYSTAKQARDALRPAQELLEARRRAVQTAEQRIADERRQVMEQRARLTTERDRLLRAAQAGREEALRLHAEAQALADAATALDEQAKAKPETCDRCGQAVGGAALKRLLDGLHNDAASLLAKGEHNIARAKEFETSAAVDVERADEIAVPDADEPFIPNEELEAQHLQALIDLGNAEESVVALEANLPSDDHVKTLAAQIVASEVAEAQARANLSEAQNALGRAQADLERRNQTEARYHDTVLKMASISDELSLLRELERAYGRDGIPALIMESTAIPKIEREAEQVLSRLGVPFRIELRTQATLKTSDRLRDTLEVIVHEPQGERRYESFSGGERARINLALRLGIAKLLAHRRGAEIEMLALDEVEALDASGVACLAELLQELQPEIPVILFISHVEQMSDAFDTSVLVEKRDGVSRLVAA